MIKLPCIDVFNKEEYPLNQIGAGKLFAEFLKPKARYCSSNHSWLFYNGVKWVRDCDCLETMQYLCGCLEGLRNNILSIEDFEKRNEYMRFFSSLTARRARETLLKDAAGCYPVKDDELNENPYLFNLKNGTYNFKTMKFQEHNPDDLITYSSPVIYNENSNSTLWENTLNAIFCSDTEKINYFLKACAYSLTALTNEKQMFILYGTTTNNGKSTVISAVQGLSGDYGTTIQPCSLEKKKFAGGGSSATPDLAILENKRFISVPEPDKSMTIDSGLLKQLTGGTDPIAARKLHRDMRIFIPTCKFFMHCNSLPTITDDSLFASSRINVITCEHHFKKEEQNQNLLNELLMSDEMSGIFNSLVNAYKEYNTHGLIPPKCVCEATESYRLSSDKFKNSVNMFFSMRINEDPTKSILVNELYDDYLKWLSDNGKETSTLFLTYKAFTKILRGRYEFVRHNSGFIIKGISLIC